ncbi:uncharacterized protein IL334_007508 [Kwoniella shivajii]|uniref:Alpha 1,6-mannosyltransferase n=1 Tax=Kwoniella shivajii TaxID=564305 RepID=A0ABZ1D8U6_9TREE|nr:hypothetical protein IL334_007508 [Kwoniella shivajii]
MFTSSSDSSRRSSSDQSQSSTSTFYNHSPISTHHPTFSGILTSNSKSGSSSNTHAHSRNSSKQLIISHMSMEKEVELDPEKGQTHSPSSLLSQQQPPLPSPSLDHAYLPLPTIKKNVHIGLRRRRLLAQALTFLGILTIVGWYILNEREEGLINNVFGQGWKNGKPTTKSEHLPGVIIGSNGKIHSNGEPSGSVETDNKELSYGEKMAALAHINPPEWGISLSSEKILAGLRRFPENPSIDETIPPLSSLGHFADNIYSIGPLTMNDYMAQMREFANIAFPKPLSGKLVDGLKRYLDDNSNESGVQKQKESWETNKKIWQTDKDSRRVESNEVKSWKDGKASDEGWEWEFLNDQDAEQYVNKKLAASRFQEVWDILPSGILRSDTLRYLLILLEGGIYSDVDTTLLRPPSAWGRDPKLYRDGAGWLTDSQIERVKGGESIDDIIGRPSVVVGLEADVGDREDWFDWWPRPIQIVQWTITSAPNHPIALNALLRILHSTAKAIDWSHSVAQSIKVLKDQGRYEDAKSLSEVNVLNEPKNGGPVGVMAWTGPGVWTDAVLSYLRVRFGLIWTDLKDLREPLRVGDVLILPVTGFSPGVGNFGAQMSSHPQAMVEHGFAGSWKNEGKN